jgi:hypothetical protein
MIGFGSVEVELCCFVAVFMCKIIISMYEIDAFRSSRRVENSH